MDVDRLLGTELAGYSIESVLGQGGMGVVYLARQRSPDRKVALKLIAPTLATDDSFRRRFLRESTAAAAIDHPHILPVYDAGESDGVLFIAMRLVDGEDLRTILRDSAPLDLELTQAIVGQIGSALDAAHARGMVHRDVKPGNILVTRRSEADDADFCYLTDFGVSTWTSSSAGTQTATGHMVGSLNYTAPEQIEGLRVDGRADQYSLGCVLYECLTGHAPFEDRSPPGIMYAHLHEEPTPPSTLQPGLPPEVDAVVARSMRKAPAQRYASCRELTLSLRSALAGVQPSPPTSPDTSVSAHDAQPAGITRISDERSVTVLGAAPPRAKGRSRRWAVSFWIAGTLLGVAAVVGTVSVALLRNGSHVSPPSPPSGAPQLVRSGVQVTASSTAPNSTDAGGRLVMYLPSNVLDGDVETAWRTPGDGRGATLTLLFDRPVRIVKVGLIPGYAKYDPVSAANRFEQDRIIKRVRYLIPGIAPRTQTFKAKPWPQLITLSATTSSLRVQILETTESGGLDYTAISEMYVYGYPA